MGRASRGHPGAGGSGSQIPQTHPLPWPQTRSVQEAVDRSLLTRRHPEPGLGGATAGGGPIIATALSDSGVGTTVPTESSHQLVTAPF